MASRLKQLQIEVIDFFFPPKCIGCGKIGDFLCVQCTKRLPSLNPPFCQRCGRPETSGTYCHECWAKTNDIDFIRSVFIFNGIIRDAVHSFKYNNLSALSGTLGTLMADYCINGNIKADVIVPVPLHKKRMRERGYNQSELLAREISQRLEMPVNTNLVERIKDNQPQVSTNNAAQRKQNVKNIFGNASREVSGKDIILIDDVCTSGATLEACSAILKLAGASRVIGLTLAREI